MYSSASRLASGLPRRSGLWSRGSVFGARYRSASPFCNKANHRQHQTDQSGAHLKKPGAGAKHEAARGPAGQSQRVVQRHLLTQLVHAVQEENEGAVGADGLDLLRARGT